jgi:hypothetical protein
VALLSLDIADKLPLGAELQRNFMSLTHSFIHSTDAIEDYRIKRKRTTVKRKKDIQDERQADKVPMLKAISKDEVVERQMWYTSSCPHTL